MDAATFALLVLGLVLLVAGAEALVRGGSRLAVALGISPLVIGLTVVAYGTSAPEMAVSVKSAWSGQADLALGNVVGSNIFNVLLILGLSAAITPLVVSAQLVRLDVPLMIGVSVTAFLMGLDGRIGRLDGALLFAGALTYTLLLIRQSRKESAAIQPEFSGEYGPRPASPPSRLVDGLLVLGSLGLLVLGSRWLVAAAVTLATSLGVSELIIGLTIVAAGTSLPEVATSITAAVRGERDIAVGNVVGSNIFNILAVLGASALVAPGGVAVSPAALRFDVPVMIAVAIACLPVFASGHLIARWEGLLFLFYYAAYTLYIVLQASRHDALPAFSAAMVTFVLPLTALTLLLVGRRAWRERRAPAA
jgi:cation:H+ antiporter